MFEFGNENSSHIEDGIAGFNEVLNALDAVLEDYPRLRDAVFEGCEEWRRLLQHKLVPQLAGDGCLVVAVTGGTNTGKSTVFNMLLNDRKSAACSTAAATCCPVLATSKSRFEHALSGRILPEFTASALNVPEDATRCEMPEDTLWVVDSGQLPDSLALLDTPDVDSIERRNWAIADHIRAAGDVIVAVLTPEKYKDARVVEYFRQAHASGRLVIPLMNKANPRDNYAAPRAQLEEFIRDAALDAPKTFAIPFNYDLEYETDRDIMSLEGDLSLLDYLNGLNVGDIKRNVYKETLEYFLYESAHFLDRIVELRTRLSAISPSYEKQARSLASAYNPQPGMEMGKLLHEQIRAQRSTIVRSIARINDTALRGLSPVAAFLKKRILGMPVTENLSDDERIALMREHQKNTIERIANDFATLLLESIRDMEPVLGGLIREGMEEIDFDGHVDHIAEKVLGSNNELSDAFREHVSRTVNKWWQENPGQRRFLLELDAFMVFAPTAIVAPIAVFTSGVGAPEIMTLAGPMAGEFVARIMESRFAEQWVGLLQPWQQEQRDALSAGLHSHLTLPVLCAVNDAVTIFDWGYLEKLRRYWTLCQLGLQES